MGTRPRGLRETVVRALAKVGLVWAVVVLAVVFMAMSSQGRTGDGGYALSAPGADQARTWAVTNAEAPSTAGLALALLVLVGGLTVLAIGATRTSPERVLLRYAEPEPTPDHQLPQRAASLA
jgi:hypothetical protein